jgi:hypothetical protein
MILINLGTCHREIVVLVHLTLSNTIAMGKLTNCLIVECQYAYKLFDCCMMGI